MKVVFKFSTTVLTRDQLNNNELANLLQDGEMLSAIVPYGTSDDVSVITMKKEVIPDDYAEPTSDALNAATVEDANATLRN